MFNSVPKLLMEDVIDAYVLDSIWKTLKLARWKARVGKPASLFYRLSG